MGSLVMALALAELVVAVPASAQRRPPAPPAAREVPPLPSEAPPARELTSPAPNFADAPFSFGGREPAPARGFDPATSVVVEEETTPTRRVFLNEDGSKTAVVDLGTEPQRYLDPATGRWHETELDLVAGPDGSLAPRAAERPARFAPTSSGAVATVGSPAGDFEVSYPGAAPARATAEGATATYPRALGPCSAHGCG